MPCTISLSSDSHGHQIRHWTSLFIATSANFIKALKPPLSLNCSLEEEPVRLSRKNVEKTPLIIWANLHNEPTTRWVCFFRNSQHYEKPWSANIRGEIFKVIYCFTDDWYEWPLCLRTLQCTRHRSEASKSPVRYAFGPNPNSHFIKAFRFSRNLVLHSPCILRNRAGPSLGSHCIEDENQTLKMEQQQDLSSGLLP